ncbi:MAG: hypothetical protein J0I93_02615 [Legionella sp.]|nr:hypothetical protein [Legionella sp.]
MANSSSKKSTSTEFEKLPERIEKPAEQLTFGNVHYQDIQLIRSLYENGVLDLTELEYQTLQKVFGKCQGELSTLTQEDIQEFDAVIASVKVNATTPIHFDAYPTIESNSTESDFEDNQARPAAKKNYANDYFTLKILQKLKDNGVLVNINNDNEQSRVFVSNYENIKFFDTSLTEGTKNLDPTPSMLGLQKLLEEQLVSLEQVDQLIAQVYPTSSQSKMNNSAVHDDDIGDKTIAAERKNIHDLKYRLLNDLYRTYGAAKKLIFQDSSMTQKDFNALLYVDKYTTNDAKDAQKIIQCIQEIRLNTLKLDADLLGTLKAPVKVEQLKNDHSFLSNVPENLNKQRARLRGLASKNIYVPNQEKKESEPEASRHKEQKTLLTQYRVKCTQVIDQTKNNLTEYPKWKKILANIGLAIAGIGIFYGIAVLINKKVNNHYTFFNKGPINADKLRTIEDDIKEFGQPKPTKT